LFHETLMEPSAYRHFTSTGQFREGTMFALVLHSTGEGVLPARRGRFAGALQTVEMAVKDTAHRPEGWAYYNFRGANGLRNTAQAMPKASCYNCHLEHAKRDNVFLQFYPLLEDVAPRAATAHAAPHAAVPQSPPKADAAAATTLAVRGLDPVLLVAGREEMGKPEIVASHKGYRYQFVSEPNRVAFDKEPQKYSIHNETCPVVPGAPIDPELFVVYEGKIYGFATTDCVGEFKSQPAAFVKP
jgi:YHS domain-containing protein